MNNEDLKDKLVSINRITKVVKGGRRFAFSALVVVGNQSGSIGIGHGKAKQVPDAVKKATENAKNNMIAIRFFAGVITNDEIVLLTDLKIITAILQNTAANNADISPGLIKFFCPFNNLFCY